MAWPPHGETARTAGTTQSERARPPLVRKVEEPNARRNDGTRPEESQPEETGEGEGNSDESELNSTTPSQIPQVRGEASRQNISRGVAAQPRRLVSVIVAVIV